MTDDHSEESELYEQTILCPYCGKQIVELTEGGNQGGHIVAQGTPEEIMSNKHSITGKVLLDLMT